MDVISKWQTKYFGIPFAIRVEKDLKPFSSKGVALKDQDTVLNRCREYFSDLLNPVDTTPTQIYVEQVGKMFR